MAGTKMSQNYLNLELNSPKGCKWTGRWKRSVLSETRRSLDRRDPKWYWFRRSKGPQFQYKYSVPSTLIQERPFWNWSILVIISRQVSAQLWSVCPCLKSFLQVFLQVMSRRKSVKYFSESQEIVPSYVFWSWTWLIWENVFHLLKKLIKCRKLINRFFS